MSKIRAASQWLAAESGVPRWIVLLLIFGAISELFFR